MIHGTADGGAKKLVGSKQAQMTTPMIKSCASILMHKRISEDIEKQGPTQMNSFQNTCPRLDPGATYSANKPAGPDGVNSVESSVPFEASKACAS